MDVVDAMGQAAPRSGYFEAEVIGGTRGALLASAPRLIGRDETRRTNRGASLRDGLHERSSAVLRSLPQP
ncbi:unnamed protein product [Lampetra fluviatilis]